MSKATRGKDESEDFLETTNQYLPTGKSLKKFRGSDLLALYPQVFDKRVSDTQRFDMITQKQWGEYLSELECALCGVPGGKCKCKPDDLASEDNTD